MHLLVRSFKAIRVKVERVGVLHDELARTHHAKAWPDLVAEFRLNLVPVERQLLVTAQLLACDVGHNLFVGRTKAVLTVGTIRHAQQQRAVLVPAPGLLPQFGRMHGRHQEFERACAVHFLAHDHLDLAQHAQTKGHPCEKARGEAPDQAGSQHELMADELSFRRYFLEGCQSELRITHRLI